MKKTIALSLAILFCLMTAVYANDIYEDGSYWTISKNNKIVNKNGYPPDEELLEKRKQTCIFMFEDIPFENAEYKNGEIVRKKKTQQEIQAEIEREEKETEYKVIYKRMKKIAIDQLEAEGLLFKYNHLDD